MYVSNRRLARRRRLRLRVSSVEHEALGAFGEALGDLGVEGVGEDPRPALEGAVGGDGGGASVLVSARR